MDVSQTLSVLHYIGTIEFCAVWKYVPSTALCMYILHMYLINLNIDI